MFDVSKIKDSLSGLIGYKQPYNPEYAIVDAVNQLSESGYIINSNPFAKIEYIKDCQDYVGISDENFNNVLRDIITDSAVNVVNQVFNESAFIDRQVLYKYALNRTETDNLPSGFVGFRIKLDDTKSIGIKITRILTEFQGTQALTIYLFNSALNDPLQEKIINIVEGTNEFIFDWEINDTDGVYRGEYFIGYIKDENTTITPFKRSYENSEIMSYVTHLDIDKVIVPSHSTGELFDLNKVEYLNESTGLNLDLTVYDDYTDLIIQNKSLFARALHLSAVINCLQIYMASLRSNSNQRHAEEIYKKVLVEIEGTRAEDNVISVKGLRPQLLTEISEIKKEITGLKEGYLGNGYEVMTEM